MQYRLIDDDCFNVAAIQIEPVVRPGPLLNAAYRLLQLVFDPAVIDPIDFYLQAIENDGQGQAECEPIFLAACFQGGGDRLVVGFNSSNLMRLLAHPDQYILAVGNIVTSPCMKRLGVRGIGTALSDAAARIAAEKCKERGGKLIYSVAEAEPESLGFWRKRGYLWPQGVQYLQPPLEFDESGAPVYDEVQETLLLAPAVEPEVLRDVIRTIYENWCLSAHRSTLSPDAMRRAESYVMERVFKEVDKTIPHESIPLVDSSLAPTRVSDSSR